MNNQFYGHALTASDIYSGDQEAIGADAASLPQDRKHGQDQPMHLTPADLDQGLNGSKPKGRDDEDQV